MFYEATTAGSRLVIKVEAFATSKMIIFHYQGKDFSATVSLKDNGRTLGDIVPAEGRAFVAKWESPEVLEAGVHKIEFVVAEGPITTFRLDGLVLVQFNIDAE